MRIRGGEGTKPPPSILTLESINNDSRASHVFCRSDMTALLRTSQYFLIRKGTAAAAAHVDYRRRVSIVSRFLYTLAEKARAIQVRSLCVSLDNQSAYIYYICDVARRDIYFAARGQKARPVAHEAKAREQQAGGTSEPRICCFFFRSVTGNFTSAYITNGKSICKEPKNDTTRLAAIGSSSPRSGKATALPHCHLSRVFSRSAAYAYTHARKPRTKSGSVGSSSSNSTMMRDTTRSDVSYCEMEARQRLREARQNLDLASNVIRQKLLCCSADDAKPRGRFSSQRCCSSRGSFFLLECRDNDIIISRGHVLCSAAFAGCMAFYAYILYASFTEQSLKVAEFRMVWLHTRKRYILRRDNPSQQHSTNFVERGSVLCTTAQLLALCVLRMRVSCARRREPRKFGTLSRSSPACHCTLQYYTMTTRCRSRAARDEIRKRCRCSSSSSESQIPNDSSRRQQSIAGGDARVYRYIHCYAGRSLIHGIIVRVHILARVEEQQTPWDTHIAIQYTHIYTSSNTMIAAHTSFKLKLDLYAIELTCAEASDGCSRAAIVCARTAAPPPRMRLGFVVVWFSLSRVTQKLSCAIALYNLIASSERGRERGYIIQLENKIKNS
ncbi:unnamed protein product [Trichogramma brassicae]|uniref:Uncharacterized protein n=1 Tax=Trichogramma brassicae TaxID=86971 RepID=A0A6H5I3M1_9HYME|nr:unnamed protein product [Trichogramma brassicae]